MSKQTTNSYHKLFPLISITLFLSAWFDAFSYYGTFPYIFGLFTGTFLFHDITLTYKIVGILYLVGTLIILLPKKDNSPAKWGLLTAISCIIFIAQNSVPAFNPANHDILMVLFSFGFGIIAIKYLLTGQASKILTNMDFIPLLRSILIIMYFFGTFHKINTDFLTTSVGCWRIFFDYIPLFPEFLTNPKISLYLAGYGTIVLEGVVLVLLLFPRTKYYGMLLGLPFHFLIGIVDGISIAHFSAFALALHVAFLDPIAIDAFKNSKIWGLMNKTGKGLWVLRSYCVLFLGTCIFLSWYFTTASLDVDQKYRVIHLMWWVYSVPVIAFIFMFGKHYNKDYKASEFFFSPVRIANVVLIMLIINSTNAYIGLKSHDDLGMFSNMRTEWGVTNHYIVQKPLRIFPYLDREYYVQILDSSYNRYKKEKTKQRLHVHLFTLRNLYHFNPTNRSTGGPHWIRYINHKGEEHYFDGTQISDPIYEKPSWLIRNYLFYSDFNAEGPQACSAR